MTAPDGDRLPASYSPPPVPYDQHEREMLKLIGERDRLEDIADRLAAAIAPADVLGEHSSGNDPWRNALDYADTATQQRDRLPATNSGQELVTRDELNDGYWDRMVISSTPGVQVDPVGRLSYTSESPAPQKPPAQEREVKPDGSWIVEEAERARQRQAELPAWARPVVTYLVEYAAARSLLGAPPGVQVADRAGEDERWARRLLARHYRAMATAVNVADWPAYIRLCADTQEDGTAWFDRTMLAASPGVQGGPVDGPATGRRLAWFSDAELAWELGRRRLAAEAEPELCRDEHRVELDVATFDDPEGRMVATLFCHEPAGHSAGELDGGHRNGSGDSW